MCRRIYKWDKNLCFEGASEITKRTSETLSFSLALFVSLVNKRRQRVKKANDGWTSLEIFIYTNIRECYCVGYDWKIGWVGFGWNRVWMGGCSALAKTFTVTWQCNPKGQACMDRHAFVPPNKCYNY